MLARHCATELNPGLFSHCSETGSQCVVQVDLELTIYPRLGLNLWQSCLSLPIAEITGVHHYAQPCCRFVKQLILKQSIVLPWFRHLILSMVLVVN